MASDFCRSVLKQIEAQESFLGGVVPWIWSPATILAVEEHWKVLSFAVDREPLNGYMDQKTCRRVLNRFKERVQKAQDTDRDLLTTRIGQCTMSHQPR